MSSMVAPSNPLRANCAVAVRVEHEYSSRGPSRGDGGAVQPVGNLHLGGVQRAVRGAGFFLSVDTAPVLAVLPNPQDTAKDIGVLAGAALVYRIKGVR